MAADAQANGNVREIISWGQPAKVAPNGASCLDSGRALVAPACIHLLTVTCSRPFRPVHSVTLRPARDQWPGGRWTMQCARVSSAEGEVGWCRCRAGVREPGTRQSSRQLPEPIAPILCHPPAIARASADLRSCFPEPALPARVPVSGGALQPSGKRRRVSARSCGWRPARRRESASHSFRTTRSAGCPIFLLAVARISIAISLPSHLPAISLLLRPILPVPSSSVSLLASPDLSRYKYAPHHSPPIHVPRRCAQTRLALTTHLHQHDARQGLHYRLRQLVSTGEGWWWRGEAMANGEPRHPCGLVADG